MNYLVYLCKLSHVGNQCSEFFKENIFKHKLPYMVIIEYSMNLNFTSLQKNTLQILPCYKEIWPQNYHHVV